MVAVKDQEETKTDEKTDLPTGTAETIIAPIIDMVVAKEAKNINFENIPTYSSYLGNKPSTGALLKLYFKNHAIEQLFNHVRHHHQGDDAFADEQHQLIEDWKTIRHPAKNEAQQDYVSRLDAFASRLNSLNSRTRTGIKK